MKIGEKEFKNIIVTDSEGGVIAIISDDEIVEHEDYKVILEPTK